MTRPLEFLESIREEWSLNVTVTHLVTKALALAIAPKYSYRETMHLLDAAAGHPLNGPRVLTFFEEHIDGFTQEPGMNFGGNALLKFFK